MSFMRRLLAPPKVDPVVEVVARVLGQRGFSYEFVPVLGLGRTYVIKAPDQTLYLTVLPYGETCGDKLAAVERRLSVGEAMPVILASKDCEPLLDGHPFILSDAMLVPPPPSGE